MAEPHKRPVTSEEPSLQVLRWANVQVKDPFNLSEAAMKSNLDSSHVAYPCVVLCGRKRTIKAMSLTRLIYGRRKFRHFIIWRDDVLCRLHAGALRI
jgi:hypothetical protein